MIVVTARCPVCHLTLTGRGRLMAAAVRRDAEAHRKAEGHPVTVTDEDTE